jgi:hypothetical protein
VALAHEELTEPERAVWDAIEAGTLVELPLGASAANDPAKGANWGQDRQVRAQLLVELLTGRTGPKDAHPRALKLASARITGTLDLEAATLLCPLILQGCSFEEAVNLNEAQAPAVRLPGCHLPGLAAKQLQTRGSLELDRGFTATSEVNLRGAHIGGDLVFAGATLSDPDGVALHATGLTVQQSMSCSDGFTAHGEVNVRGAHIDGDLVFAGATLVNPNGDALMAARASVDGAMICGQSVGHRGGFTAQGEVVLNGAHIGASLNFAGATLNNPEGVALAVSGLTVEQNIFCSDGFTARGGVNMFGARIGGFLSFVGAILINPNGYALMAPSISVGGRMFCGSSLDNPAGFTAEGVIWLTDAHIGGFLTFEGASLENPGGAALIAWQLTVDQDLSLSKGFSAVGKVDLSAGRVRSLDCSGGAFRASDDGLALSAEGLSAADDVLCTDGFTAEGEVTFRGARIGGRLSFDGATLTNPNPDRSTLDLQELDAHVLSLRPQAPPEGHIDLTHAHVRVLVDPQAAWPQSLGLWSFVYEVLYEHPRIDVTARLAWLERDPRGYAPQPYEQLAAVYRRAGRDEDARRVAIAKQRRRRKERRLPGRAWGVLLDVLVGYGYRTWLGGLWLLGLLLVGWVVFARAYPAHMIPANQPGEPLPHFQPLVYALDTLLPVVDLHQQDNWIPLGLAQWWAWVSILAGWVLTAAVAAALTGLIKKE